MQHSLLQFVQSAYEFLKYFSHIRRAELTRAMQRAVYAPISQSNIPQMRCQLTRRSCGCLLPQLDHHQIGLPKPNVLQIVFEEIQLHVHACKVSVSK